MRVPEPSWETSLSRCGATSSPPSPEPASLSSASGVQPAAPAARTRSSPSATNVRVLSRQRRPASFRTSLSVSLLGLVMGMAGAETKRAPVLRGGAPGSFWCRRPSGRQRLAGGVGKSAERVGIAHGDVGEDLAVDLDPGELEAVHERAVGEAVLARGGVDAGDPQAAE